MLSKGQFLVLQHAAEALPAAKSVVCRQSSLVMRSAQIGLLNAGRHCDLAFQIVSGHHIAVLVPHHLHVSSPKLVLHVWSRAPKSEANVQHWAAVRLHCNAERRPHVVLPTFGRSIRGTLLQCKCCLLGRPVVTCSATDSNIS